jgi:hypothetical protein
VRNKSKLNRLFQCSALSVAAIGSCSINASHPVLAQGPGVQVIRLNGTHESASPPAASQVFQPAPVSPIKGSGTNATDNASSSSTNAASSASASSGKTFLTGGTSVGNVELSNVRDILLDVRRAQAASAHLYGEVTRHPITGYTYADSMGPVMIEIPMPTFDMSEVLPARRQWVELYMGEISSVLAYVKADLDSIKAGGADLSLSPKDKPVFEKDLQEASATIDRAVGFGEQLKKLTVASPYDNLAIARLISPLHKDLKEVEKTTKRLIGQIKKSH